MFRSNDSSVSAAFSKQSLVFDRLDEDNKLSGHLRNVYRNEVLKHLRPKSQILELNCGTGLDAMFFAGKGHEVLATDNAPGMIKRLNEKVRQTDLKVQSLELSFHDISQLFPRKFDHIVSNFGGLNCTNHLDDVLNKLPGLLKPGGKVTLVIMPKVCPWELVMALKGNFKTAFRRFRKGGTPANVEGVEFLCYYYDPSYVKKHLKQMEVISLKGIYITVPPEFYKGFVERYPRTYGFLNGIDKVIAGTWPFNRWCDHFLITLKLA
jgi:ubiquinone/menaquinone biosynthesis C-methylase UbiE